MLVFLHSCVNCLVWFQYSVFDLFLVFLSTYTDGVQPISVGIANSFMTRNNVSNEQPPFGNHATEINQTVTETASRNVAGTMETGSTRHAIAYDTSALQPLTAMPATRSLIDRSLTWPDKCDVMLCETAEGNFLVNATACSGTPVINTTRSITVRFVTETDEFRNHKVRCELKIATDRTKYINTTIGQLSDKSTGKFKLRLTRNEIGFYYVLNLNNVKLKKYSASLLSSHVCIYFENDNKHPIRDVTLQVGINEGSYVNDLPVVMLSNTVGYVMSPGLVNNQYYPNDYISMFNIDIAEDESLLANAIEFKVEFRIGCSGDVVVFRPACKRMYTSICTWKQNIMAYVFRCSLSISFRTNSVIIDAVFKIMFALLPRSQEPRRLPSKLFNCSVPSFQSFKPMFSCNKLTECEKGEDEQNCVHDDNGCGTKNSIDAGTKCYVLILHKRQLTWFDAHLDCIRRGQKLAILEDFRHFKSHVPSVVDLEGFFVGAQLIERLLSVSITYLYRNIWQWVDGRTLFSVEIDNYHKNSGSCALYNPWFYKLDPVSCHLKHKVAAFVCEFSKKGEEVNNTRQSETFSTPFADLTSVVWNVSVVNCPSHHMTRDFLSCDVQADCDVPRSLTSCSVGGVTVPTFVCQRSMSTVHYTLVCDHMQHCTDNSDEEFCKYPECSPTSFQCHNDQCTNAYHLCDSKLDCYDGSDEAVCSTNRDRVDETSSNPGLIHLDGRGNFRLEQTNAGTDCPATHIRCPQGHCLPVYLRCNGVVDCMGREDEAGCDRYKCHGYYRCRGFKTCLHPQHVCDGIPQCPQQDDELLCDFVCPDECRCQGLAFVCTSTFPASSHLNLRYLDASDSNISLHDIRGNVHLVAFRMSRCHIDQVPLNLTFPNLRRMDLSWNKLNQLDMQYLHSLANLRYLVLTGNPLVQITHSELSHILNLEHVDLSYTLLTEISRTPFASYPYLKFLNISWNKLMSITEDGFHFNPLLETIDLTGSRLIKFPKNLLKHLTYLKTVHAENYKLCCEAMLPVNFDLKHCRAKEDLQASCKDLLKSNSYRILLWVFAAMSLVGNVFTLGTKVYQRRIDGYIGSFNVFVTNLSVSDLFMGVYLSMIGTADLIYRDRYLWRDDEWKNSVACKVAGFFCLMSSEASAFIICLITLDRFLVLRFPFSGLHFRCRSAVTACGVVWAVGIFLAMFPVLPVTSHWEFYSQTGICIPLPFTGRETFLGWDYSFGISILLNLVLFLLIAVGQAFVYFAVRVNSMPSSTNTQTRDAAIARRLITVIVSDFLCWFPIGLLGLLASTGTLIPGELNVAMATFVLPVNSALNPFLYTFNLVMEKRRKAEIEKLLKRLDQGRREQVKATKDK